MYNIVEEMLERAEGTELILLDGYPASRGQVRDLFELTVFNNRTVAGLLHTKADEDLAVMRMIKRRPRNYDGELTVTTARDRFKQRSLEFTAAALELSQLDVPFELIDTSGSKESTTRHGLLAVQQFLDMSDDRRFDAS
jgi:adenylate kinase family enzyme